MKFDRRSLFIAVLAVSLNASAHDVHAGSANCGTEARQGCSDSAHADDRHGRDHGDHTHTGGAAAGKTVEIGELALKTMGLTTIHPQKRRMNSTVTLWGRMEPSSDARRDFPSPVSGRLSLKVRELDHVKKGDVLFTVDSPAIKSISHEINVLKSRLLVYRKLKTTNAEIESALKVKLSEKAAITDGAEETNGLVTIRATTDGVVEKLNASDGAWMETGSAAVTLVNMRALRFRTRTAASEAAKISDGAKVIVSGAEGRIRIGVGGENGMIDVYAVFAEKAPGRAGDIVKAECVLDENEKPVLAVPDACVMKIGAEPIVFVRDHRLPGRFHAVKVALGVSADGWTQVLGIPDNGHMDIVKDGAYELKLALSESSGTKATGHYHADGTFHEDGH